jgi:hypothetical protein
MPSISEVPFSYRYHANYVATLKDALATCEPCADGTFTKGVSLGCSKDGGCEYGNHRALACQPHKKVCDEGELMLPGGEGTASSDLQCTQHTECDVRCAFFDVN